MVDQLILVQPQSPNQTDLHISQLTPMAAQEVREYIRSTQSVKTKQLAHMVVLAAATYTLLQSVRA